MKYNYTKEGYHPEEVSFEVSAILMEEERAESPENPFLFGDVTGYTTNYSHEGYAEDLEKSFNIITDKPATTKYLLHKNHKEAAKFKAEKLKQEKQRDKQLKNQAKAAFLAARKSLSAVIQAMLTKFNLAKHKAGKGKNIPTTALDINKINEILYNTHHIKQEHKVAAKAKVNVQAQYLIHPHVDSLFRERYVQRGRGLSI